MKKIFEMKNFGRTLTDREYGRKIAMTILEENIFPLALDFKGVMSLGSSCGDEIFNAIGPKQEYSIEVFNVNDPVRACLDKVSEDSKVVIVFSQNKPVT